MPESDLVGAKRDNLDSALQILVCLDMAVSLLSDLDPDEGSETAVDILRSDLPVLRDLAKEHLALSRERWEE